MKYYFIIVALLNKFVVGFFELTHLNEILFAIYLKLVFCSGYFFQIFF
jgi:hypothetical protein